MKVKDLVGHVKEADLGLFLKFYGRTFFALMVLALVLVVFVNMFMVAPANAMILLIIVLSALAWIAGEVMTTDRGPGAW